MFDLDHELRKLIPSCTGGGALKGGVDGRLANSQMQLHLASWGMGSSKMGGFHFLAYLGGSKCRKQLGIEIFKV